LAELQRVPEILLPPFFQGFALYEAAPTSRCRMAVNCWIQMGSKRLEDSAAPAFPVRRFPPLASRYLAGFVTGGSSTRFAVTAAYRGVRLPLLVEKHHFPG